MRRFHRAVMLATLIALTPVLAGCANFDPDSLDVFGLNEKKKLPGDRKPLFPEGVPGVSQGIPPELMRGNAQQQAGAAIDTTQPPAAEPAQKTAAVQPAEEPKAKPKRQPRLRQAARPPAQVTVQPSSQEQSGAQAQQPAPWPEPAQQPPQQAQSPWPAPNQSSSTAPWPSAPPPGTFSK